MLTLKLEKKEEEEDRVQRNVLVTLGDRVSLTGTGTATAEGHMGPNARYPRTREEQRRQILKRQQARAREGAVPGAAPQHHRTPAGRHEGARTTSAHGPLVRERLSVLCVMSTGLRVRHLVPLTARGRGTQQAPDQSGF